MADDVLHIERRERVAILTLNRPDRLNALSVELRDALTRACQELRDDDQVWAVVLTGAGRGFCSGVDLRTPRADNEQSPSRQDRLDVYGWVGRQAMAVYRTLDKPIIAAVNGVAAGAGMSLALSCDMRVGLRVDALQNGIYRTQPQPGFRHVIFPAAHCRLQSGLRSDLHQSFCRS